jgi:hypothetical protein
VDPLWADRGNDHEKEKGAGLMTGAQIKSLATPPEQHRNDSSKEYHRATVTKRRRAARGKTRKRSRRSALGVELVMLAQGADPVRMAKRLLGPRWYARWVRAVCHSHAHTGELARFSWRELDSPRARATLGALLQIWEEGRKVSRPGASRDYESAGPVVWRGRQAARLGVCEKTIQRITHALRASGLLDYHQPPDSVPEWMRGELKPDGREYAYNVYRFDLPRIVAMRLRAWFGPKKAARKSLDETLEELHPMLHTTAGRAWLERAPPNAGDRDPPRGTTTLAGASILSELGIDLSSPPGDLRPHH